MDLLAVAVSRELVDHYTGMCRRAGLKLRILAPDVIAFRNLLRVYGHRQTDTGALKDYVILDLGDESAHLHFFTNGEFEVTRSLDTGCLTIVEPIAAATGIDPHLILMGQSGSLTEEAEQSNETFLDQCNNLALSVMRVLNFYSYNNPNNSINALYVCGAGIRLKPLINEIAANIELPLLPATELIPHGIGQPEDLAVAPQSYGICVGKEG
jgi:type IV pilus assembly protein PilM